MKTQEEIKELPHLIVRETADDGGCGLTDIFNDGKIQGSVIWSWGAGWDHVSVHPFKWNYVPTWDEMCRIKDMFFREDEWVVQFHPAHSEYVNQMPNCLHLWRPQKETMPTPPTILTGIKDGQTVDDVKRAIKELYK